MPLSPPPGFKPPIDLRNILRLQLPWTITGNVVRDYAPFEGIPDVIVMAIDALTNREVARTTTRAKGDYSFEVAAGSSSGYLIRPERLLYSFTPPLYRVYGSLNVPRFEGHNNK